MTIIPESLKREHDDLHEDLVKATQAGGETATAAPGQFRHDAVCFHAGCEHMAVIAVAGDDLVAVLQRHLHSDDDGFLADVEMTETADCAHAVKLTGLFLETPDQQHLAQRRKLLLFGEFQTG